MTPYEAYVAFLSIKTHFSRESYDYFKYSGKLVTTPESYEARRDKYFFEKLSRKENPIDWLLANVLADPKFWVGKPDADQIYTEFRARKEARLYTFETELRQLDGDLNESLRVPKGSHPVLLQLVLAGKLSMETLIILERLSGFNRYWNTKMRSDPLWIETRKKLKKYAPFVDVDINRYREVALRVLSR